MYIFLRELPLVYVSTPRRTYTVKGDTVVNGLTGCTAGDPAGLHLDLRGFIVDYGELCSFTVSMTKLCSFTVSVASYVWRAMTNYNKHHKLQQSTAKNGVY